MRQAGYTPDRTSGSDIGDALSELLPEGYPCCTNHVDDLGLSENGRVDLIAIIAELVTWLARLVWIHR